MRQGCPANRFRQVSNMTALAIAGGSAGGILDSYGLRRVARFFLRVDAFIIEVEDRAAANLPTSIYAFVVDDEIRRIGCSTAPLCDRLERWQRDVTAAMRGRRSGTPTYEAAQWRRRLEKADEGLVFARQAQEVASPVGWFPSDAR